MARWESKLSRPIALRDGTQAPHPVGGANLHVARLMEAGENGAISGMPPTQSSGRCSFRGGYGCADLGTGSNAAAFESVRSGERIPRDILAYESHGGPPAGLSFCWEVSPEPIYRRAR